jgi:hypothetical protein
VKSVARRLRQRRATLLCARAGAAMEVAVIFGVFLCTLPSQPARVSATRARCPVKIPVNFASDGRIPNAASGRRARRVLRVGLSLEIRSQDFAGIHIRTPRGPINVGSAIVAFDVVFVCETQFSVDGAVLERIRTHSGVCVSGDICLPIWGTKGSSGPRRWRGRDIRVRREREGIGVVRTRVGMEGVVHATFFGLRGSTKCMGVIDR